MTQRIYIAGPMTADTRAEVRRHCRAFRDAWDALWDMGHWPHSPCGQSGHRVQLRRELAKMPPAEVEALYRRWLAYDFSYLDESDAVLLLPGWEQSRGAKAEWQRAVEWGMTIYMNLDEVPKNGV